MIYSSLLASGNSADLDGRLVVYRVLAVGREYTDRPDLWTGLSDAGPKAGDKLRVSIGDLPEAFIATIQGATAASRFALHSAFIKEYKDLSEDQREAAFESLMPDLTELREDFTPYSGYTHITLEVERQVKVKAGASKHLWLASPGIFDELEQFGEEAGEFLDVVSAALLSALPLDLLPTAVVHRKRQAYIEVAGRTALASPQFDLHAGGVVAVSGGWRHVETSRIESVGSALGYAKGNEYTDARTASRWLWAAMAEDKDVLREFMFAFFGLEVLANKVGKRHEKQVVKYLADQLNGLPVAELFWPTPKDADSPWRNLVFRFAVMAVKFDPAAASEDVEKFKALARARNNLAHGNASDQDVDALPGSDAVTLLRKYLGKLFELGSGLVVGS